MTCDALGSNLGDRAALLRRAASAIAAAVGPIEAQSAVYETPPMYITDQPPFLNAAVRVRTDLTPHAALAALLTIERDLGRARSQRFGPRLIDLDLLLYDDLILDADDLTLPHPRLTERRFALAPLADIAPTWRHPRLGLTASALLSACPDPSPLTLAAPTILP
jgi:2-amino-4-hydroxy-6-hydroxymethyldihydropteridine diphosphokinase